MCIRDRTWSFPYWNDDIAAFKRDELFAGTHVIREDVAGEISRLKQQNGRDMLVAGSSTRVQALVKNDLADEYHLLLYPLVLGSGKRLFQEGASPKLRLVESQTTGTGVLILTYQPV